MAQQHPPFPKQPPYGQYITHIWAYSALKADAALSRLMALGSATDRKAGDAAADTAKAIWMAVGEMSEELAECARKAQQRGELLFCWHGTQATTVSQSVAGDEVSSRAELAHDKNQLMALITSPTGVQINPKNLPPPEEANDTDIATTHYVLQSLAVDNELQPLALDNSDRRYLVVTKERA